MRALRGVINRRCSSWWRNQSERRQFVCLLALQEGGLGAIRLGGCSGLCCRLVVRQWQRSLPNLHCFLSKEASEGETPVSDDTHLQHALDEHERRIKKLEASYLELLLEQQAMLLRMERMEQRGKEVSSSTK